jgi:hypothetical protein
MTAISEHLARRFAERLDFRAVSRELELFFYQRCPQHVRENPSSSAAIVDRALGVDTTTIPLAVKEYFGIMASHLLTREQFEHMLSYEQRLGPWDSYLASQEVSSDELTRILALPLADQIAETVVMRADHFGLAARADIVAIVERAGAESMLYWLAGSSPGEYLDVAPYWLKRISETLPCASERSSYPAVERPFAHRGLLRLFVERRPDLITAMLDLEWTPLRTLLASSRHLTELAWQRQVIGGATLDLGPFSEYLDAARSLIDNPRCHVEVLDEINQHLGRRFGPAKGRRNGLTDLHKKVVARLTQYDEFPRFDGDYATEKDPATLAWLVEQCRLVRRNIAQDMSYDVQILATNPLLSDADRKKLTTHPRYGLFVPVDKLFVDGATTSWKKTIPERCDGTCSPRAGTGCGLLRCTTKGFQGFQSLGVDMLCDQLEKLRSNTTWKLSTPIDEWLIDHLGQDPATWATFLALSDGWTLTVRDLVDTARLLKMD